jgi:chromosome segregation ATPase
MRFALWDVLTVGGPERADRGSAPPGPARAPEREVLPATTGDGRLESEALAIMAGEFRRLREQEQSLHRRQAESLESVAEALARLADGRPAVATDHEAVDRLRAELDAREEELRSLRHAQTRGEAELDAARAQLAEAQARADRSARRLESTQGKLKRARDELAVAKAPWWRRRRARATLG